MNDYKNRQQKLVSAMKKEGIDACLISVPTNLYYLTGRIFDGYFYMDSDQNTYCFIRRGKYFDDIACHSIRKPEQISEILRELGEVCPKTLMLEEDYINVNTYQRLSKVFEDVVIKRDIIRNVRSVKTDWEVSQLRESAQKHTEAYKKIPELFKHGMSDIEFSIEIERLIRLSGNLGIFRVFGNNMEIHMGSILVGDNAGVASPYDFAIGGGGLHPSAPISANGTKITDGNTIIVDINGNFTGYISDMSRIFCVGELPQFAYDAHNLALGVQEAIVSAAKPGVSCGELYDMAIDMIKSSDYWEYYMENTQGSRFVGHGLGLEINESPVLFKGNKAVLEENMCVALEPKFALPGIGAVGIENTFVVKQNGLEKLTTCEEKIIKIG